MTKEFKEYRRKLNRLTDTAFHEVVAETLNAVGGSANTRQRMNVKERFTLRNRYTERSLRWYKATPKPKLWKINSVVGTISGYMDAHEKGGHRKPKRGKRVPVATLAARGGSKKKVIRRKYYAGKLGPNMFIGTPKGGSRPPGIWERYRNNKRLRMIRNLENPTVAIQARHWHTDATKRFTKASVINAAFLRYARKRLQPK